MDGFEILKAGLKSYAQLDDADICLAQPFWKSVRYKKAEFFNMKNSVCKHLGFIIDGLFRVYYIDPANGDEINMFFFSEHEFVVSFKSFTTQTPCQYFLEALTEATTLELRFNDLERLYQQSHAWERFGRKFAEDCFNLSQMRAESLLFQTPEQRYLDFLHDHPRLADRIPLYQIASFLGIKTPSLSRIRKRIADKSP